MTHSENWSSYFTCIWFLKVGISVIWNDNTKRSLPFSIKNICIFPFWTNPCYLLKAQIDSIKLFGNAAYPASPNFYFNQTQLIQSNPGYKCKIILVNLILIPSVYVFNYDVLEAQKTQPKPTFIFPNPAKPAKPSS